jgi:choline dehydrogenase-like flavoprotein
MHIDARQLESNSVIEGDICIIGAGASGISIALDWENTPYKVILLEGGGFDYDDKVQELYNGKITGLPYYPMKASRLHYFGGSTGHWGGFCAPYDEMDFEKRDWVENSGWPIKLKDIAPYYPRVHPILDLGPCEWDVKYWEKQNTTFKKFPFDEDSIWSKVWQISAPTRFGSKYKEAIVNAKNIHLYTYANVVDIVAEENIASVKEVKVKNYAGKQHTVKAKHFILACCAIQNARVLLACNKQVAAGLGNENDQVGRYFMEHPLVDSGELWLKTENTLDLYKEGGTGVKVRAQLSVSAKKQRELQILNVSTSMMPLEFSKNKISYIKMWSDQDPRRSLDSFKKYFSLDKRSFFERHFMPSKLNKAYGLTTIIEQVPNPLSRVVISSEKDELGMYRADLDWKMVSIDKKTVVEAAKLLAQQVGASGLGRVRLPEYMMEDNDEKIPDSFVSGCWHHLGTTRMSENPKNGVVDADCRLHSVNNLYIAGSSCFTTGGCVNPTYTVVALSLRLSEHLKKKIKE